jgi:hypothetical protein
LQHYFASWNERFCQEAAIHTTNACDCWHRAITRSRKKKTRLKSNSRINWWSELNRAYHISIMEREEMWLKCYGALRIALLYCIKHQGIFPIYTRVLRAVANITCSFSPIIVRNNMISCI